MNKKNNHIKISKEKREVIIDAIKKYFFHERNEELGDLAAMLILDFIIENIAPEFYNQGVYDAYNYMGNAVEDLLGIQKL